MTFCCFFQELFGLLQDGDALPPANALASNLSVELTAGGLTPEHTNYVSKITVTVFEIELAPRL